MMTAVATIGDDVDDVVVYDPARTAALSEFKLHPFAARAAMLVWSQMFPSLAPFELNITMWHTAETVKVAYQGCVKPRLNIDIYRTD